MFGGNNGTCGLAVRFVSLDFPAIKTYIEDGGRLFIVAEHTGGCFSGAAQIELNNFLSAVGSSMSFAGFDYNNQTPECSTSYYTPGAANIAQGITFTGERFGEVSGGTSVWLGSAGTLTSGLGRTAVAAEQLGDGFLFVSGDSNHGRCAGYCDFIKRLWEYGDDEIL